MSKSELITIGAFARRSGLTTSALRFYADSGLLTPASVDQASGYRYYARDQIERAVMVRRLREIDMPLERIAEVLESDGCDAARMIDEHVAALAHRAHEARATATAVKAALNVAPESPPVRVGGSVFTTAVEQILTATIHEPDLPALNGVHIEVSADTVTLTATDRYRLSTRTLVTTGPHETGWSATVDADHLRLAMPWTRRQIELRLSPQSGSVRFRGDDATTRECRVLAETFPDYRLMLASLPEVRTRILVSRNALVRHLENTPDHRILLRISESAAAVVVSSKGVTDLPPIKAVVTGPAIRLAFALTTLYPAISTAVGPDVMLDIAGVDQPVVVRSADDGDLTTLVMPVRPGSPPDPHAQKGHA